VPRPPDATSNRVVLVTGATSGIGLETARALGREDSLVVLGVRDPVRGQAVADEIARGGGRAEVLRIDLASFESVREAARRFLEKHHRLDALVNNAGVAIRTRQVTADGHERTWQTNFLGGFLLTRLLLPALKAAPRPRVVNVSSEAHRTGRIDWSNLELEKGYGAYQAYANTKLGQVLFTRELARREPRIQVNAVHPGVIATNIWREVPAVLRWIPRLLFASAAKGAAPVVRLASAPEVDTVTGRFFKRFRETDPSYAGRNDADAARLWDVAERSTGTP